MTRPGFMLLELLVSMVIASMIALALFASFSQTNRAVYTVDTIVDVSYKQTVAINQLTKDISGAFIPVQGRKKKSQEEDKKQAQEKKTVAQIPMQNKKEQKKILTKIFYGTAKDGQLNILTCITNNSTLEYPVAVVRVVYRIVPEKSFNPKKPAYVLLRQESATKFNFDDFKQDIKEGVRAYELIGNIKKITVAYTAAVNKPQQTTTGSAKAPESQQFEREYKVLNEWVMEEEQEKQYKDYTKIPFAVDVDLVLWDDRKEREHKVSFKIMLPNEAVEYEPEAPKAQPAQQTPTQQTGVPAPGKPQTPASKQQKTAHNGKASALDQTYSALKTMLLAEGAMSQKGAP